MNLRGHRRGTAAAAALVAVVLGATACGSSDGGGGSGGSIKVGAVASLTGPVPFPDATAGAKAAFDEINAKGGIDGRMIEYVVKDDASDPATATQVARQLVDEEGVVGNVASLSAAGDCVTNAPLYERKKVYTIGLGLQLQCSTISTFAPVNAGPVISGALQDIYVAEELGIPEQCFFGVTGQGARATYAAIRRIAESKGVTFKYFSDTFAANDSPTPFIVNAKQAGCRSLYHSGVEPSLVATLQAADAQGYEGVIVSTTSAFTESVIEAAGGAAEGVYSATEFAPLTSDDEAVVSYRKAMEASGGPISALSEGGYIAAQLFASVLGSIDGDITAKSVAAALDAKTPLSNPLLLDKWVFGHYPNRSIQMMQVTDSAWAPVGDVQTLPESALRQ